MQNKTFFFVLFSFLSLPSAAQTSLPHADTLFRQGQYEQALATYEQSLAHKPIASPQRLLRMAFLRENAGDYTPALYYLSLAEQRSNRYSTLKKMEELAARYRLKGYELTEQMLLQHFYYRYYLWLAGGVVGFHILLLMGLWRGLHRRPYRLAGWLFLLTASGLLLNLQPRQAYVLLRNDAVYLREAPGAGSRVVAVLPKGHRLPTFGEQDVWIKVQWEGKTGYIHRKNLWLVF
jgi:tetratricopeptide (TPR) repeat protein